MEFVISKRVQYEEVAAERLKEEQVSKELHLKSSQTQTLNKKAVLNRIRNHKCIHNLKSLLHTSAANSGSTVDAGYRWIDSGDIFSCP
ncbi:BnaC08g48400D [Brassica napus]|uniref:BnaC08g48400D protein n=1 Tax=Brassica napus TaxID=3708 RepID=A0A078JEV8_BRANA|nr:BnaC08g48400D [Brassica napus]